MKASPASSRLKSPRSLGNKFARSSVDSNSPGIVRRSRGVVESSQLILEATPPRGDRSSPAPITAGSAASAGSSVTRRRKEGPTICIPATPPPETIGKSISDSPCSPLSPDLLSNKVSKRRLTDSNPKKMTPKITGSKLTPVSKRTASNSSTGSPSSLRAKTPLSTKSAKKTSPRSSRKTQSRETLTSTKSSVKRRRKLQEDSDVEELSPNMRRRTFPLKQFQQWLDAEVEQHFRGWDILEKSRQVTDGNRKLEAKHIGSQAGSKMALKTMTKAQYGRAKYNFVRHAIAVVGVQPTEKFADIGSGVGTVVLQVAATIGCVSSIGVELCAGRHNVAIELNKAFAEWTASQGRTEIADRAQFFSGDFREKDNFSRCRDADVLFVNNAESIFGMRSVAEGSYTLDWHVARLACGMRTGSRIVTFEALTDLEHPHIAPCFERQEYLSEPGATSWTEVSMKQTKFFCYTKIGDQWTCSRCTCVNELLRPSRSEWGESLHETCEICEGDPAGHRKAYSIRNRQNRSTQ